MRIEAGLYAAERMHRAQATTDQLSRSCAGI